MNRYWLSLGSNLGEPIAQLISAINALSQQVRIIEISSLYETDPVGPVEQNCFINLCLTLECERSAPELLMFTQSIEHEHHRTREIHWGPRTLDIDLLMGPEELNTPSLTLPHPHMLERDFVMIPLAQLKSRPHLKIPYPEGASDTVRIQEHPAFPCSQWTGP